MPVGFKKEAMIPVSADILTEKIIGAAIEVHRHVGPGHLESFYRECLRHELLLRGLNVEHEVKIPIRYKDLATESYYRLDLVVENEVLLELKAVEAVHPVHVAQALTYLANTDFRLALLINFNVPVLVQGVKRLIRKTNAPPPP